MTTETMTIHKALCELKTLDSRIRKLVEDNTFAFANKHSNTKVSGVPIEKVCESIGDAYKSIQDLISRRDAIKRAVTMSNATTKVVIGGIEYSVAEAIEMKNHGIPLKQLLLRKLSSDLTMAKRRAELENGDSLEKRADEHIKLTFGDADRKNLSGDISDARETFIKAQTMEVIDPIKVEGEIKSLRDTIDAFMVDVDSALSVSNALTSVTVEY